MNPRRWLLFLLPAALGLVLVVGWYVREIASAAEESRREIDAARERANATALELKKAQARIRELKKEREGLQKQISSLQARAQRRVLIDEIPGVIKRLRGLELRHPLKVRWVDQAFTKRYLREEISRQIPEKTLSGYTRTLSTLGLLPRGYDLSAALEGLMGEQAAGFYDARTQTLFVRERMPAGEFVLAHEIAHALQDQRFELAKLLRPRPDQDDRSFALHALVEGDATLVMELYLIDTLSLWKLVRLVSDAMKLLSLDTSKLEAAPLYVRESLVRSYLDGKLFVEAVRSQGGWARVNRAYRSPPESSEQILHPEKFLRGEKPVPVQVPDLRPELGPQYKPLHENTLGELGVSSLLRGAAASRERAESAAAGWGGDRLRSYARGKRVLLVWRTAWDSVRDAREFEGALTAFLDERHGRASRTGATWKTPTGTTLVTRRSRQVLLVVGAESAAQAKSLALKIGIAPP